MLQRVNKNKIGAKLTLKNKISILRYHNNRLKGIAPAAQYSAPRYTWCPNLKKIIRKHLNERNILN